jgi:hypothetical protein
MLYHVDLDANDKLPPLARGAFSHSEAAGLLMLAVKERRTARCYVVQSDDSLVEIGKTWRDGRAPWTFALMDPKTIRERHPLAIGPHNGAASVQQ